MRIVVGHLYSVLASYGVQSQTVRDFVEGRYLFKVGTQRVPNEYKTKVCGFAYGALTQGRKSSYLRDDNAFR